MRRRKMVIWSDDTKQLITNKTNEAIVQQGIAATYTNKDVLKILKNVISSCLPKNQFREITSLSVVPWLKVNVGEELQEATDNSFNSIVESQNELLLEQSLKIEHLTNLVEKLLVAVDKIAQSNQSGVPAKPKRVLVLGDFKGQQKRSLIEGVDGYKNIRLNIMSFSGTVDELPLYEHAIVMEWVVRSGTANIKRLIRGDFQKAMSVNHAIQLISQLAGN